jgi:hypothetical protein
MDTALKCLGVVADVLGIIAFVLTVWCLLNS